MLSLTHEIRDHFYYYLVNLVQINWNWHGRLFNSSSSLQKKHKKQGLRITSTTEKFLQIRYLKFQCKKNPFKRAQSNQLFAAAT